MNHPINSNNEDMFILSPQVDYNGRPPVGGLVGYNNGGTGNTASSGTGLSHSSSSYSVYPQQDHQQQHRNNTRMYFTEELLDDGGGREIKSENANDSNTTNSSFYGKYNYVYEKKLY